MNFMEKYDKLVSIAYFIQSEKTGSLDNFAKRCEIEKRTLSNLIDTLRQFTGRNGAEIRYNRDRKTYYFDPPGKFTNFEFKEK